MKKMFTLFMASVAYVSYGQYTTPNVNGTITANEYGTNNNTANNWNVTWDATNLYIGIAAGNTSEGAVFYLDINPQNPANSGINANGSLVGQVYDNTDITSLPFRADVVFYIKNSYREYRMANGNNGWGNATSTFGTYADDGNNTREVAIPWSIVGGIPASFNLLGYVTSASGYIYNQIPSDNPGGNGNGSATYNKYYYVSTTADGVTSGPFKSETTAGSTILPISFGNINLTKKEAGINVAWQVLTQSNILYFEVEKSVDGINFTTATIISNTNAATYNWADVNPLNGNNFYRIKAVGKDGEKTYSAIAKINTGNITATINVFPNPVVNNAIHLQMNNLAIDNYKGAIYNAKGQFIYATNIQYNGGNNAVTILPSTILAKGIYQLNVKGSQSNFNITLSIR